MIPEILVPKPRQEVETKLMPEPSAEIVYSLRENSTNKWKPKMELSTFGWP